MNDIRPALYSLGLLTVTAILAACGGSGVAAIAAPIATNTVVVVTFVQATTTSPTATATATPTPTHTPTPTPTPLHPLMIEYMRQQTYPGSQVAIEQTLEAGDNYERYLASYLSEGNKIFALLTVPGGQKPDSGWPVIIFNHGFIPPAQYRTTERYVAYVDGFARNGYIVFRSDYRGHGNSEGEASGGYGSPGYTVDVLNAVAAIKNYAEADPERIGMWGHSMGGHITLRAMVVTDDIKAGVIWAGVVGPYPDLFQRGQSLDQNGNTPPPNPNNQRGRWRRELLETYGSPEENPEFWASISPNSYLDDLSGPIQLHHGSADSSVPVAASEFLNNQLQQIGRPVEFYLYDGDDHNISTNFDTAMERSIQFFDTYVKAAGGA